MTASTLLAYIVAALLAQLAASIGIALWRRRVAGSAPLQSNMSPPADSSLAWSGWRNLRVARREFEDPVGTQCSFYLEPVDGASVPPFKPGQFLTFSLPVLPGRSIIRCYSLSDRSNPTSYRITVKRIPAPAGTPEVPGGASSSFLHNHVHVGDVLKVKAPSGQFCLDPDPKVPAVLIAGGIGITPLFSMLRWCLTELPERTVHLYYGVRNSDEHVFKQALDEMARTHPCFHLNVVYSKPHPRDVADRDYQHTGHIDVGLLRRTLPHGRHQFYVCGPAALMQSLIPALSAWGVPALDIHYEAFGPASIRSAQKPQAEHEDIATQWEVQFRRSGRTLLWDARESNLLEFAERHGIQVQSGCRSGSCGTCETSVISGTVHYAREPDHPLAAGHCLLCIGTPESALILEA